MTITPFTKVPELLHFRVAVLHVVFHGETARVEDAHVAPEPEEDSTCFEGEQARE